jgi:hypothetical protein
VEGTLGSQVFQMFAWTDADGNKIYGDVAVGIATTLFTLYLLLLV